MSNEGHFAIEPVLTKCNSYACSECIDNLEEESIHCYNCNGTHEKGDLISSPIINLCGTTLSHLFHYVEGALATARLAVQGN